MAGRPSKAEDTRGESMSPSASQDRRMTIHNTLSFCMTLSMDANRKPRFSGEEYHVEGSRRAVKVDSADTVRFGPSVNALRTCVPHSVPQADRH